MNALTTWHFLQVLLVSTIENSYFGDVIPKMQYFGSFSFHWWLTYYCMPNGNKIFSLENYKLRLLRYGRLKEFKDDITLSGLLWVGCIDYNELCDEQKRYYLKLEKFGMEHQERNELTIHRLCGWTISHCRWRETELNKLGYEETKMIILVLAIIWKYSAFIDQVASAILITLFFAT